MPRIADSFLAELDQEAQTTRRVLERVPGDKLSWKPHTKSMSLGQLALHVATIPSGVAQILSNDSFEVPSFDQPAARSATELIRALDDAPKVMNTVEKPATKARAEPNRLALGAFPWRNSSIPIPDSIET